MVVVIAALLATGGLPEEIIRTYIQDIAPLPDGRVLVAGRFQTYSPGEGEDWSGRFFVVSEDTVVELPLPRPQTGGPFYCVDYDDERGVLVVQREQGTFYELDLSLRVVESWRPAGERGVMPCDIVSAGPSRVIGLQPWGTLLAEATPDTAAPWAGPYLAPEEGSGSNRQGKLCPRPGGGVVYLPDDLSGSRVCVVGSGSDAVRSGPPPGILKGIHFYGPGGELMKTVDLSDALGARLYRGLAAGADGDRVLVYFTHSGGDAVASLSPTGELLGLWTQKEWEPLQQTVIAAPGFIGSTLVSVDLDAEKPIIQRIEIPR